MIAKTLFELYTVAIGNGNIIHVHTKHQATYVVSICNSCSNTCPSSNLLLSSFALPVAYNNLARYTHTSTDMTKLNVAMCRLVEVHEVHVDVVPWNFSIVLCMEVEERLLKRLKTLNPHLCRRECVHPCDNTNTLLVVIRSLHDSLYFGRRICCAFINNLNRNDSTIVESIDHLFRVTINNFYCFASIKKLCACYEPNF